MTEETFTCDNCGQEFPKRQMKEAFVEEDGKRVKKVYDAGCLDKVMNQGGEVQGVAGEEKRAAVRIDQDG